MGSYAGTGQAKPLDEGRQLLVWDNEVINTAGAVASATSLALRMPRTRGVFYPTGFSIELAFAGAPGNFECDILTADTDNLAYYIKRGSLTQADLNSNNVCRAEFTNAWCRYVVLQMVSLANAVAVNAMVSR